MESDFLHVANGTSTTDTIKAAGLPGVCSVWADVLHDGPVPEGLSDDDLLLVRARHLASSESNVPEVAADLKQWRAVIDDDESYRELVLWYEHDLFCQLNLIQVLTWIAGRGAARAKVSLICIGSFPGRDSFKGLGELTAGELAPLLHTRQRVTDDQYALAERAWRAFRSSDPRDVEALVSGDTSALPFLAPALRRHLEELPSTRDGLSRSERRLLNLAANGPIDLWSAFPRMHDDEDAFYILDGCLATLVEDLAATVPPLLIADLVSTSPERLPKGTISLTETGRAVLAGEIDRVRTCGVDRWLGGVHLRGKGETWRWDSDRRRVVKQ